MHACSIKGFDRSIQVSPGNGEQSIISHTDRHFSLELEVHFPKKKKNELEF